jgi:hypothetical protein
MVRRSLVLILLVSGLLAASLATADAATVSPDKWAPKFCKAVQKWQKTVESESNAATDAFGKMSSGDLTGVRDEFVRFLGNDVAATQTAIKSIKQAGTPSSANGAKIQRKIVGGFQSAATVFDTAKTKAQALSTTDAESFVDDATKIQDGLSSATDVFEKNFSDVSTLDKNNELAKALQGAKACKFLTG